MSASRVSWSAGAKGTPIRAIKVALAAKICRRWFGLTRVRDGGGECGQALRNPLLVAELALQGQAFGEERPGLSGVARAPADLAEFVQGRRDSGHPRRSRHRARLSW